MVAVSAMSGSGAPFSDDALESAESEHIYLSSEPDVVADTELDEQHVIERLHLKDGRRRVTTELTLYEGQVLKIYRRRGKKRVASHTIKLRYLDPNPSVDRRIDWRSMKVTLGAVGLASAAAALAYFELLRAFVLPIAGVAAVVALVAAGVFYCRSRESTSFYTMHGRARAIVLTASVGQFGRGRAIVPKLVKAINAAEGTVGDDTALYLRAEMREHYRLRGDGVLSNDDCSESTGRILMHFDNKR